MVKVLVDGRVNGADGIGRYTRQLIASLLSRDVPDLDINVLEDTGVARYTRREGTELAGVAETIGADVVHVLDYRTPIEHMKAGLIVTVHDVFRATDPYLCYSDEQFEARFGVNSLAELKLLASALEEVDVAEGAGISWHDIFYRRMLGHSCSRAAAVVVPTRTVANELSLVLDRTPAISICPYGADHLLCSGGRRSPLLGSFPYFLYVGQARAHKGLDLLISAYQESRASDAGIRLVFAGRDFQDGTGASDHVDAMLGQNAVRFGEIDDGDLAELYRKALALIHLARHEGFGFTPLEAISLGIRVVVRDIPVLRETLGPQAYFCSDGPEDIAEVMNRLMSSPDPPAAQALRRSWVGRYRWRDHTERIIALYRSLRE